MLVPFLHRVVIKPEKVEDVDDVIRSARAAGIEVHLDKREQKAVEIGIVCAVGDTFGTAFSATVLPKVGDRVYFAKYSGKSVKDNGEDLLICNDEDIVAIIKE